MLEIAEREANATSVCGVSYFSGRGCACAREAGVTAVSVCERAFGRCAVRRRGSGSVCVPRETVLGKVACLQVL